MSRYLVNLPAAQMPANAMLNFQPVNNALEGVREQNNRNALMAERGEERTYQRGRDALQDQRVAKADARQDVEWFGRVASAVDRETDPNRRAQIWQQALKRHPAADSLTPDYLDPMTGPKLVMAEAGQWRDPREDQMTDAKLQGLRLSNQLTQARIGQVGAEGASEFGLTPQYAQDADGNIRPFVTGKDGSVRFLDLGEGRQALGPEGVAAARVRGNATGKAQGDLAKTEQNALQILGQLESLEMDPELDRMVGPVRGRLPNISGGAERVQSKMDQVQGAAFLAAFETLKGGGQITEIEGKKATDAITRLTNPRMSPNDYREAIRELKAIVTNSVGRAREQAGGGMPAPQYEQPAQMAPAPSEDGWQTLPNGVRIREKQ